jgi:hypothetical protein
MDLCDRPRRNRKRGAMRGNKRHRAMNIEGTKGGARLAATPAQRRDFNEWAANLPAPDLDLIDKQKRDDT